MAEVVCVKFEYLGYRNNQGLCGGGGGHAGSGSDELVPLSRWGSGQGKVYWKVSCCLTGCLLCVYDFAM
jgi:hypothetical protein